MEDLGKEISGFKGMTKSTLRRAPWAFITFRSAEDCSNFLLDNETNTLERVLDWSHLSYDRYPIFVYPAPEPAEILWENLGYGNETRIPRHMLIWLYVTVMVIVSGLISWGLAAAIVRARRNAAGRET